MSIKTNVKAYVKAFRENTDDVRKNTLMAVGTLALTVAAGIFFSKRSEDQINVFVIEENPVIVIEDDLEVVESEDN